MREHENSLVIALENDDIDLLRGVVIDPVLRRRLWEARHGRNPAPTTPPLVCELGLTDQEALDLIGLISEVLLAEGLKHDGQENAVGLQAEALAARIVQAIEAKATEGPRGSRSGSAGARAQCEHHASV